MEGTNDELTEARLKIVNITKEVADKTTHIKELSKHHQLLSKELEEQSREKTTLASQLQTTNESIKTFQVEVAALKSKLEDAEVEQMVS